MSATWQLVKPRLPSVPANNPIATPVRVRRRGTSTGHKPGTNPSPAGTGVDFLNPFKFLVRVRPGKVKRDTHAGAAALSLSESCLGQTTHHNEAMRKESGVVFDNRKRTRALTPSQNFVRIHYRSQERTLALLTMCLNLRIRYTPPAGATLRSTQREHAIISRKEKHTYL